VLQSAAECCTVLRCIAVRCAVLRCVALCCAVLQCAAPYVAMIHDECMYVYICTYIYIYAYIYIYIYIYKVLFLAKAQCSLIFTSSYRMVPKNKKDTIISDIIVDYMTSIKYAFLCRLSVDYSLYRCAEWSPKQKKKGHINC